MNSKGKIKTHNTLQQTAAQIKEELQKVGVPMLTIDIRWDLNTGATMVAFEFEGRRYERKSVKQRDAASNLHAIKMNLIHKVTDHLREVEPFHDSMHKYAALPPSADGGSGAPAPEAQRATVEDWATLGVPETATGDQIKSAYRRKAQFYHPDRFLSDQDMHKDAEAQTSKLNAAYGRIKAMRGF